MSGLIVHEWLAKRGGSENVVVEMTRAFPDARVACLWNDGHEPLSPEKVDETWLARTPLRRSKIAAMPFMLGTWRRLAAADSTDWMLVSSHLFAHHARLRGSSKLEQPPKFVYAHTPARYIWTPDLDARGSSLPARAIALGIRPLDRARAREAVEVAANSEFVRARVEECWRRDARVIYPPVDIVGIADDKPAERLSALEQDILAELPEVFILGASRFVPYKRLDAVMELGELLRLPVVVAGAGPDEKNLRDRASELKVPVHFVIAPSTDLLRSLYRAASLYVFPPVEDFGIMPVEALASGCRTIVNSVGGAAESATRSQGGAAADFRDLNSVGEIAAHLISTSPRPLPEELNAFSSATFQRNIRDWVGVSSE